MNESKILNEDYCMVLNNNYINWDKFKNKKVLITGGTGLIGQHIVNTFVFANKIKQLSLKLIILARNKNKAMEMFSRHGEEISILENDLKNSISIEEKIDYIIHCASPTASSYFVENPVETIQTAVLGTNNMLKIAKDNSVKGFIYLSSMEVYGRIQKEISVTEDMLGHINHLSVRSSYPEAKRLCEALCCAYANEYNLNCVCIRLAQTFGPGVNKNDKRVFAMMARCVLKNEDIKLNTPGTSKHPYIYTADAVSAIITCLLNGEKGNVYNAANPETYCSIYEMGKLVIRGIGNGNINIHTSVESNNFLYPENSYLKLDVSKIYALGWRPKVGLIDMYKRMIFSID